MGYRLDSDSRLIWLASCFPIIAGDVVLGQDSLLLALAFLFAFLALKKGREVLAGIVLGLGLFRFEIVLPFVAIFFLRRRWKMLSGFTITALLVSAASLGMVGLNGMFEYTRVILAAGSTRGNWVSSDVTAMPSLRGFLVGCFGRLVPSAVLFSVIVAGSLLVLCWAARKFGSIGKPGDRAFDVQFSLAVIAALIASYHLFPQEMTPLIVASFLLLGYEGVARRGESLWKRPGALLLLLFALAFIVDEMVGFRSFSVLFIVLLGLMVWLSQEIGQGRNSPVPS